MGAKREGAGGVERTTKVIYGWLVVLSCNHSPSCDMAGHSQALQAPDHLTHLGRVDIVICGKFLLVPVRSSPVPSVVRGSAAKILFLL